MRPYDIHRLSIYLLISLTMIGFRWYESCRLACYIMLLGTIPFQWFYKFSQVCHILTIHFSTEEIDTRLVGKMTQTIHTLSLP